MKIICILIFGLFGVLSRFLIHEWSRKYGELGFPYPTLAINLLGSFLIGLFFEKVLLPESLRMGLMVGFLGGFTTFSAYSLETLQLLQSSRYLLALLYGGLSPVLGVGMAFLGVWCGKL